MDRIVNTVAGYRAFEYALVLNPNEEVWKRILKVKEQFADTYKTEQSRLGRPHILLANFIQYEMMEDRILNRLRIAAMAQPAFKIELKDFGSFPSHTIYINVASKVAIQSLVKTIRSDAQRLMKMNEEHKPHFIMEPYITIASKLKPWQYEKGWLEYSRKHFTARFIAEAMTILKRPAGELKYQSLQKFSFQNLPVATRQGELFV